MVLDGYEGSWFAVQVRPRREMVIARALGDKGYEYFAPVYVSRRRWSDRWKEVQMPLFPGYVFCRFSLEALSPIIMTPGVLRIVGTRREPVAIPDSEIQSLARASKSNSKVQPHEYLAAGARVRITDGPLAGLEGTVRGYGNQCYLILSIYLIRRSISVEIDHRHIELVHTAPTGHRPYLAWAS
ncbi:MAG TPA: UpxY family transcription antiterminator [Candidatus Angelobacter sp.]|nr:UpxY family transcription antiterminator [Candidatus Angelobacter sp.]